MKALTSIKNMHGCTPLHFLAEGHTDFHVAEYILRSSCCDRSKNNTINPLLIPDEDGDLPLHYACSCGLQACWLELFLKYGGQKAVHMQNSEGSYPVDDLIVWHVDGLDDNEVVQQQEQDKEEEDMVVSFQRKWEGIWPQIKVILHAATTSNSSRSIDRSYPLATPFLPIHAAASIDWFPAIILCLTTIMCPNQLSLNDDYNRLPLHYACMDDSSNNDIDDDYEDSIHTIYPVQRIDTYPELLRWGSITNEDAEDDDGSVGIITSPLSLSSSTIIQYLAGIYPEAAKIGVPVGNKSKGCNNDNDNDSDEKKQEEEGMCFQKTRLPLHFALEGRRASMNDIQVLLHMYPEALTTQDGMTGLYPFMTAASSQQAINKPASCNTEIGKEIEEGEENDFVGDRMLDKCYELLRLDPELVRYGLSENDDFRI
mmetsp:Transcript_9833/g.14656  ORF Transcript_9833/g.14656 Transcript_9833/m.14656 type:complete len:427 (-) Transcript_9833:176-1456(-)